MLPAALRRSYSSSFDTGSYRKKFLLVNARIHGMPRLKLNLFPQPPAVGAPVGMAPI